MLTLINPIERAEPFDHAGWVFEAKFDGFWAAADTVRGQLISRNGNRMQRFERVLDLLPRGHVFDGELVVLDGAGRSLFNELLFARRPPTYVLRCYRFSRFTTTSGTSAPGVTIDTDWWLPRVVIVMLDMTPGAQATA
jgi:hypothetical protein